MAILAWDLPLYLCSAKEPVPPADCEIVLFMIAAWRCALIRRSLFCRVWADRVKQEERALSQRSAELRRHLSSGGGQAAAIAGGSYFGGAVKRPTQAQAPKPAGAQQFLAERYASSKGSSDGARGAAGGGSGGRATAAPPAPSLPKVPAAPAAPAAVVARGVNPFVRTSNAAASELPVRTAVLQRPPAGATEGVQSGSHAAGTPLALPSKPAAPQLPAHSSANGTSPPIAALPSPTKDAGATLALPQHESSNGNSGGLGGVRGWIDGLRSYRSSGDEEDAAPVIHGEPAPVRDDAESCGQVTPEAPPTNASSFNGHSPAAPMVVALGMASALASVIQQVPQRYSMLSCLAFKCTLCAGCRDAQLRCRPPNQPATC